MLQELLARKIICKASGKAASAKDFVLARVDAAMAHDGTSVLAVKAFEDMGASSVWDSHRITIVFDHMPQLARR